MMAMPEDRVIRIGLELEALVDLVPADPAQIVPLRVEEQLLELLARGLEVGRVARTEQRVDLLQGLGLAVGRVLGQRVLDEGRLRAPGREQHLDLPPAPDQLLAYRSPALARLHRSPVGHVEGDMGGRLTGRGRLLLVVRPGCLW